MGQMRPPRQVPLRQVLHGPAALRRGLILLLPLLCALFPVMGGGAHAQPANAAQCRLPPRVEPQACPQQGPRRGRAGDFDHYLLALSWSPEYCATRRNPPAHQCRDNRFGFVVHGLWPQYRADAPRDGHGWPQYCTSATRPAAELSGALLRRHLCLLPAAELMACQWSKHGSCGDFDGPAAYFDAIEDLARRLVLPRLEPGPTRVRDVRAAFLAANPGLPGDALVVTVAQDHLAEVRLCVDRARTAFVRCDRGAGGSAPDRRLQVR